MEAKHPILKMQSKQAQQLSQILRQKLAKEVTANPKDKHHVERWHCSVAVKHYSTNYYKNTFLRTISRGSCSARVGSLRKNVSFSTLSFKLSISIKWIVSTNLFWKYSAITSLRFKYYIFTIYSLNKNFSFTISRSSRWTIKLTTVLSKLWWIQPARRHRTQESLIIWK